MFPLVKSLVVIRTAAKLHNFLIDTRDDNVEEDAYFRNFSEAAINDLYDGVIDNHDEDSPYALVSDNNEPRPRGDDRGTNFFFEHIHATSRIASAG